MKRPLGSRWTLLLVGALVGLSTLLAGCGGASKETTGKTIDTSHTVEVAGPPCQRFDYAPYVDMLALCIESVYNNVVAPEAAPELNGLALSSDGTLYFTRTAAGEIWALRDADGDQFMDAPFLVVDDLDLPLHLALAEDALYVVTAEDLLRLEATGPDQYAAPEVIVAGLRGESLLWPGAVRIGPDGRLYVGVGASDSAPGAVVSYARDGSDRQVVATGLRSPANFAWNPQNGDLWIADSRGTGAAYDALFRVPAAVSTVPDFGYPVCVDGTEDACGMVTAPVYTFDDQSAPVSLAFYTFDEWPYWSGDLFVSLHGSWNRVVPSGYAVEVVALDADGLPTGDADYFVPSSEQTGWAGTRLDRYSLNDLGLFPEHPVDIVFDHQGWLYMVLDEGRIYRVRPRPAQ